MKIIYKNPWFFFILKWFFPALNSETAIITFGDTIYSKHNFPDDVRIHEEEHIKQQKGSKLFAVYFTIRFILSPVFRLKMELEAYRVQYKYAWSKGLITYQILTESAKLLSGPLYGNLLTYDEAIKLIKDD